MMRRLPAGFVFALALAACAPDQSVLHPSGEDAARIYTLSLTLFIGAAVILLLVGLASALAISGPPAMRRWLKAPAMVMAAGIAFPVVTLTALLTYGLLVMRDATQPTTRPALRIVVTGEQWWWRVRYEPEDGPAFASANEIRIPVGQEVELELRAADVIHSFWVPALAGKLDMIPGRVNHLRISAERPGIYRGQCAEYCGGAHAWMAFEVIALPEAEFQSWRAASARETATGAPGAALFVSSGCGACHRVGGISEGTIGPDLTRLGERRFIGAAMLPLTQANLTRFVTDVQHLKPGAGMPPFGIFTAAEQDLLSAYLMGLR